MSLLRSCAFGMLVLILASARPARAGSATDSPSSRATSDQRAELDRRLRTEVWDFGFEEEVALAPRQGPIPGEWERYLEYSHSPVPGQGEVLNARPDDRKPLYYGRFPDFMSVEVIDGALPKTPSGAVHGGRRALRMGLSGARGMDMVAVRRRVPLEIDPGMAYELKGWVRLENVTRDDSWAQLRIEWLDEKGRPVGEVSKSGKVDRAYADAWTARQRTGAEDWVEIPELRVDAVDPRARCARVWCVASGSERSGFICFDDIAIRRRPRLTVNLGGAGGLGILAPGEPATLELHFQGLEPEAEGRKVAGYRRTLHWTDIAAPQDRSGWEPTRSFSPEILRDKGFSEHARLTGAEAPGVYAVTVVLEEEPAAGGERRQLVRRVVRLVRLAGGRSGPTGGAGTALCAADVDLYSPDAPKMLQAFRLSGLEVLAFPVWRPETDPKRFLSPGDQAGPEDAVARLLRQAAARRVRFEAVLAPVPAALRGLPGASADARSLYRDLPRETWAPLVEAAARQFGSLVSEWRVAAADDTSLAAVEREKLAADLHKLCGETPGWIWSTPVPLDGMGPSAEPRPEPTREAAPGPAAEPRPDFLREIVYVPAETDAESLDSALRKAGAGRRRWFLELPPAEPGQGTDMEIESERRQAGDLARKLTVLAAHGAAHVHVALADRTDTTGRVRQGLLGPGLAPRAAYSAYSLLAGQLTGTTFVGELDLAPGTRAYAFQRGSSGLVVFWSDGPKREVPCQLGATGQAELLELTGRRSRLQPASAGLSAASGTEMVPLSDLPALLIGVDPAYVLTRRDFRLAPGARLEARYRLQEVGFEVRNHFPGRIRARVHPRFPRGTQVKPGYREVDIAPGQTATVAFSVRPSFVETAGEKQVDVDLWLQPDKGAAAEFSLTRSLPLESMMALEPSVRYPDDQTAEVEVTLRLRDRPASADVPDQPAESQAANAEVSLTVPGELRQAVQLLNMRPGSAGRPEVPFRVKLGPKPRKVYLGARLAGSEWFVNSELTLRAAGKPR